MPKEARKIGLNEETLRQIKKRIKEGKKLRLSVKVQSLLHNVLKLAIILGIIIKMMVKIPIR